MSVIIEATFNSISHLIIKSTDVVYIQGKWGSERLNYRPEITELVSPETECLIHIYLILKIMTENTVLIPEFYKTQRGRPYLDFTKEKTGAKRN